MRAKDLEVATSADNRRRIFWRCVSLGGKRPHGHAIIDMIRFP